MQISKYYVKTKCTLFSRKIVALFWNFFYFSRSKHRPLVVLPIAQRAVKKCCKNFPRKVLICCWRLHKIQNIWRIWQDYLHYYQKTSSMMLLNVFQIIVKMIKICCGTYIKRHYWKVVIIILVIIYKKL